MIPLFVEVGYDEGDTSPGTTRADAAGRMQERWVGVQAIWLAELLGALLALHLCASGCQPRPAHEGGTPADERGDAMPVPVYPGLQHVGDGRVYGEDGTHIVWDAYATADPPAVVAAHYRAAFSRDDAAGEYRFEPGEHGGGIWRRWADDELVAVVNVLPVEEPGPHQELGDRLPRSAKTVVIVSRRW